MAATLDHVSDGRLTLGLGAGWQPNEHAAYGIELLPSGSAAGAVRGVRRRDPVVAARAEHHGGRRVVPADRRDLRPAPVQRPLPMLVGGGGEQRTMRVAALHAEAWHTWRHRPSWPEEHRARPALR
jgi:alkanesulfonate monooxygenase SsuD/methylene tetrahydromethanopterin reductase-like flavin-dependent oxidoreductase (luciferase family)